jgi:hypothetical protein
MARSASPIDAAAIRTRLWRRAAAPLSVLLLILGCAHAGRLTFVEQPLTPADTTGGHHPERALRHPVRERALFLPDTVIGFQPGTGDSSRRYLGKLLDGYTADTLNILLFGDNRPGYRSTKLAPELAVIQKGLSPNPLRLGRALITIPWLFVKGLLPPDVAIVRDIPPFLRGLPTYGREKQVLHAIMAKLDTLKMQNKKVAAAINTGDLVYDGTNPAQWRRFLRLSEPLMTRVPYFAIPGNHEKTHTETGVANWRVATGLPIAGDRFYYCFDSADGWVRFVALDTNPITMPGVHWSRDVQVKYSKEQVDWLTARLKEHHGPSFVFFHSPPLSAGYHRHDWNMDPVMQQRREAIVRAMHDAGISVLASGHEHDYERALMTFPDGSVLICIVQGGGGAPLHPLPSPAKAAQLFAEYHVAGGTIKPENVYTAMVNNFTLLQLWFGGGQLQTYAVDKKGNVKLADLVKIDLKRYGTPKIDQHKVPIAATAPVHPSTSEVKREAGIQAKSDTTAASRRIESHPPPGKKKATTVRRTSSRRRR